MCQKAAMVPAPQMLSNQPGREREVVVLHEDDGTGRGGLGAHGLDEAAIHQSIRVVVARAKDRLDVRAVTKWPEPFVGESLVKPLVLFLVQPHPTQPVRGVPERNLQPVAAIDDRTVGRTGPLRHPYTRSRGD